MCFFGMFNMYACRVNMSVAVVAMTKNVTLANGTTLEPRFTWSSSEKGLILSSFFYGYVSIQVFIGILLRKVSAHLVFGIGTVVPGLLTLVTPVIAEYTELWVLVASRVVMGLFQGVAVPCLMSFWTLWAPPLERARLHGIAVSGAFVGTVFALPLSGVLGENLGWESIFYVIGGICVGWYIVWLILIRASPEKDTFISEFERDYIRRTIGQQKHSSSGAKQIPWKSIFSSIPVWGLIFANFGWGWGYVTMLTQLPQFLSDMMNFDLGKSGFLSALPYLTMAVMSLVAGYLADFLLVKQLLTVTQVRKYYITFSMIIQAGFIVVAAYVLNPVANIICISLAIGFGALTYSGVGINYIDIAPAFAAVVAGLGKSEPFVMRMNTYLTSTIFSREHNGNCSWYNIASPDRSDCKSESYLIVSGIDYPKIQFQSDASDFEAIKNEWTIIFFIAAAIYLVGALIYWFTGSAKPQTWGKFETMTLPHQTKTDENAFDNQGQGYKIESQLNDECKN